MKTSRKIGRSLVVVGQAVPPARAGASAGFAQSKACATQARVPAPRGLIALAVLACAVAAHAEVVTLTLRQAVELAGKQNPDLALARLDELKARLGIRTARGPFLPKVVVGSGLAYTNGFPTSIEGSAPSVIQAQAQQFLFNRQQTLQVAQAKEDARGAAIATQSKRDEAAYRIVALYLD